MNGDFKEFFTTEGLDDRKLAQIEFVLNSPAYIDTFKPYMMGILNALNKLWKDRSQSRKEKYNDDYLAGGHDFGEGLIEFFDRVVNETNHERVMEQLAKSPDQIYGEMQRHGLIRPIVGANQRAEPAPYDPAEDY